MKIIINQKTTGNYLNITKKLYKAKDKHVKCIHLLPFN